MLRSASLQSAMLRSAPLRNASPRSASPRSVLPHGALRSAFQRMACTALCCCALLSAVACSKPQPPERDRPPEPQAAHELRDAIQRPVDKARAVETDVQRAADEQRAAIEASGG